MSETTPGETPVERRLREWGDIEHNQLGEALYIGADAIALLREFGSDNENLDYLAWGDRRRALLARCEGDR